MHVALSTADPNLHALAWDTHAKVAMAGMKWSDAEESIEKALQVLARPQVPPSAWQVHATASDLFRKTGRRDASTSHHIRAVEHLERLLNSFEPDEAIRHTWLDAVPVRRLRQEGMEMGL